MTVDRDDRLLLELVLGLKRGGRKGRDWIALAEKAKTLSERSESNTQLAGRLGVSPELLRALISLTELHSDVQQMVRDGRILFDAAQRLHSIKNPGLRLRVAFAIQGLPSHAQREAIKFAKRNPESKLPAFIKRLAEPGENEMKLRFVVVSLSPEELSSVKSYSKKLGVTVNEAIRRSVIEAAKSG